jgi:hypothetical protein
MKIVTVNVCPPIPCRDFDWCAHFDDNDEDGPVGWGSTPEEAIDDLRQWLSDEMLDQLDRDSDDDCA